MFTCFLLKSSRWCLACDTDSCCLVAHCDWRLRRDYDEFLVVVGNTYLYLHRVPENKLVQMCTIIAFPFQPVCQI